jgi:putative two-component system response regulator
MATVPTHIKNARVMIVDDNLANVVLLQRLLQAEGYTCVEGITDSREVKALFEANPYDLVLLDIRMPNLDGYQVMEQLREISDSDYLPVMMLTAQTDHETKLKALDAGAMDFLHKPFDRVEALTRIRNMIEARLLHNQVRDQNARLEERVRERTRELEETRMEVVHRLAVAAEYKDNETGLHVVRMSKVACRLGLAAGMSDEDAELLLKAAPMHDIGKIGIADNILLKPGKLTPEERVIMQEHAYIGAEILGEHEWPLMQMARQVALTHHEKWDGSGYPHGLKGEDIPLVGRITAIADVFDALTSDRPYKEGWPIEEAVNFIKEQSGSHFDPKLVDKFLECLGEITHIRETHRDLFETEK